MLVNPKTPEEKTIFRSAKAGDYFMFVIQYLKLCTEPTSARIDIETLEDLAKKYVLKKDKQE